jgi:formamidopyrimidine-DNA glycosylase
MPELPEVETVRLGISPHLVNLLDQKLLEVSRRGKYLLFRFKNLTLLWHLGMSGSMRVLLTPVPEKKHDHVDLVFGSGAVLRFNDPRRFGVLLATFDDPLTHVLLKNLGPEPLGPELNAAYLKAKASKRTVAIKNFIMNANIVVGVGNIYATEALYEAGIYPEKAAGKVTLKQFEVLTAAIKRILTQAIATGGTSLRDFVKADGKPGYFRQELKAYGRDGLPCGRCGVVMLHMTIGGRATVYCPKCQKR